MLRPFLLRPLSLKLLPRGHAYHQQPFFACSCARAPVVQASRLEAVIAAVPGTVKEHQHHILIQTAPLKQDAAAKDCHSMHGCWWPSVVEKHPAVIQAVAAAAKARAQGGGNVKVTTYEEATRDTFAEAGRPVCDLRIYPAGVQYSNLPIEKVGQVTSAHILQAAAILDDEQADEAHVHSDHLQLDKNILQLQQPLRGMQLLVCCHGSRDTRCGKIGNELVTVLNEQIHQRQLQGRVEVLKCSHVGGHKYAGNVLVYGAMSPCDGDWFGGVNKQNAADFLNAIIDAEIGGEGGAEEPGLRHLWRGRMRMTKQQQLDLFAGRDEDSEADSSDYDDWPPALPAKVGAAEQTQQLLAHPSTSGQSQQAQDSNACQQKTVYSCCGAENHVAPDDGQPDAEPDTSSSEDESSSSSSSDSSSDSDGDRETPAPIEVLTPR